MVENLSEKEQFILNMIRKNPYISQQELAEVVGLSRPAVANTISGLIKKGLIVGRAYVLQESQPVVCIGGANIDRKFYIKGQAQLGTSNPVKSVQSAGGVARNIAENLGRLGLDATLITACGSDSDWKFIEERSSMYINLDHVIPISGMATGSYSAVLNANGDMMIALADMDVYDSMTPELIQQNERVLTSAKCIVADLNCPKETLQYLCQFAHTHEKPLVFIPVSSPKMKHLPANLSGVTWLITNRDESETFFNCKISTDDDWKQMLNNWLELGISNVVITNGKQGAMIGNKHEGIRHIPAIEPDEIVDVTGAGDAFSSAVIFSWLEGKSLQQIAIAGAINAAKTLESSFTVRQNLSAIQLEKDMEEL